MQRCETLSYFKDGIEIVKQKIKMLHLFLNNLKECTEHSAAIIWIPRPGGTCDPDPMPREPRGLYPFPKRPGISHPRDKGHFSILI